jgi:rhodanese-related sulfurtransferase
MFKNKVKNPEGIWEIGPQDLYENASSVKIVDVRRPDEFTGELGHIKNSELVTLETDFNSAIEIWPKDQTIVFICRSGVRSAKAALYAQSLGFENVYNMQGGMILWNELSLPTEKL